MKNSLNNLFYQSEDYFFRSLSKKCLDLENQATAYYTGISSQNFNFLIIKEKIPKTIDYILASAALFYKENPIPWNMVIAEHCLSKTTENNLKISGFSCCEVSIAMFLDITTYHGLSCPSHLIIRLVNDKLDHWARPLLQAFESTSQVTNHYRDIHKNAQKTKNFYHFSCYDGEEPIASLTLTMNDAVARIDDVGTLPLYQNNGIASCLIRHAIEEAKRLGATHCFLEASTAGFSIYQKIGFQPLFKIHIYTL